MTTEISHGLVRDYCEACVSRDAARIARFLHDDIEWSIAGPVDLLRFCGLRRGKSAVLDTIVRQAPSLLKLTRMDIEEVLVDGDRAAAFMRTSGILADTGRTVSYRCAQFMRFCDNRLIEFRALIDSFDAAEQVLGHAIEVAPAQEHGGDVVVV